MRNGTTTGLFCREITANRIIARDHVDAVVHNARK
jgi:hypothetical protein